MRPHRPQLLFVVTIVATLALPSLAQAQAHEDLEEPSQRHAAFDRSLALRPGGASTEHSGQPSGTGELFEVYRMPAFGDFSTEMIRLLPTQDPGLAYLHPAILALENGDVLLAYQERGYLQPQWRSRLWVTRTSDGGESWQAPVQVSEGPPWHFMWLTLNQTTSGRILLADETVFDANNLFYSDDNGLTWLKAQVEDFDIVQSRREDWPGQCGRSFPDFPWEDLPGSNTEPILGPIAGTLWHVYTDVADGAVKYYTSEDGLNWTQDPMTMIVNPDTASFLYLRDVVETGADSLLAALKKLGFGASCPVSTVLTRSFDGGATWSTPESLETDGLPTDLGHLKKAPDGTLWYVFQDTFFDWGVGDVRLPQSDIYYMRSTDGGVSWSTPEQFTRYIGTDGQPDLAFTTDGPLLAFSSTRFLPGDWMNAYGEPPSLNGQVWIGSPDVAGESSMTMPPVVTFEEPYRRVVTPHEEVVVRAYVEDEDEVERVWVVLNSGGSDSRELELYDDGTQGDRIGGDGEWATGIGPLALGDEVDFIVWAEDADGNRVYADRTRFNFGGWYNALAPAEYYVVPVHDAGNVCLELTSAVFPNDIGVYWDTRGWPQWDFAFAPSSPMSGSLGPYPFSDPSLEQSAVMRWPCPDGPNYLTLGQFVVGIWGVEGQVKPTVLLYDGWSELDDPIESSEWSDQDYQIRYSDSDSLGLVITQNSHQFADGDAADMIFLEYTIENSGIAGELDNLMVGLYLNAGIGNLLDDMVAYDARERVIYMFDSGNECSISPDEPCISGYMGLALVSDHRVDVAYDDCPDCLTDVEDFWNYGIDPEMAAGDPQGPGFGRGTLGVNVGDLGVGDSVKVAFALVMAESQEELLLTKVPLARSRYEEKVGTALQGLETPLSFALHPNYPNPFNATTTIRFDIPVSGEVSLQVLDLLGRKVARLEDRLLPAGGHVYQWNASNVASGVYLYRLRLDEYVSTRTLVLMR